MRQITEGQFVSILLEPRPQARDKPNLAGISAFLPDQRRGFAEAPIQRKTNVRRKLPPDFVAETNPEFQIVQPGASREPLDPLHRNIGFKPALKDQPLGQQEVLGQRQPPGHLAVQIDEERCLEVVVVGDQAFDSDHGLPPRDVRSSERLRFDAASHLNVVILPDEPPVEELKVHVVVRLEGCVPLPFAFEPEAVVIPSVPALDIPPIVARAFPLGRARPVFQNIDQGEETLFLVVHRAGPILPWRHVRQNAILHGNPVHRFCRLRGGKRRACSNNDQASHGCGRESLAANGHECRPC